jgi:chemotaxis protein MotB
MTRQTWIFACGLSVLALLGILSLSAWRQNRDLSKAQTDLADVQKSSDETRAKLEALQSELAAKQSQIEELEKAKAAATKAQKSLETEMRSALESKDVTISELQGQLTVNILDRVLFDSGEAELKPEGAKVLQKIAGVLAEHPKRQIQVIGHTDDVPIRPSAWNRFPSNWELSAARATAAIRYLQDIAGVDPKRMAAVAYGQFRPIAENTTAEGRARNRRIALVILPEKLAITDVAATGKTEEKEPAAAANEQSSAAKDSPPAPKDAALAAKEPPTLKDASSTSREPSSLSTNRIDSSSQTPKTTNQTTPVTP